MVLIIGKYFYNYAIKQINGLEEYLKFPSNKSAILLYKNKQKLLYDKYPEFFKLFENREEIIKNEKEKSKNKTKEKNKKYRQEYYKEYNKTNKNKQKNNYKDKLNIIECY